MSKIYVIEHVDGITKIHFSKNPTYNDAKTVIDDIVDNFPYTKRLWDFSKIKFDLTIDELKSIAEYGKLKFIKPNKLAIVAPDNWAYIELHIFQAVRKQKEHSVARSFQNRTRSPKVVDAIKTHQLIKAYWAH